MMVAPLVCIVDFHHTRGPEVERWINVPDGTNPAGNDDWSLLPFLALPDGAHSTDEAISYFTLRHSLSSSADGKDATTGGLAQTSTSVFGISCTRQLDVRRLKTTTPDIKRSSVQKAIVAVVSSPFLLHAIREKIRAATAAWFSQCDFTDISILEDLQESLVATCTDDRQEKDTFVGLSLRDIIHDYKWQVLTLFKCALLQPKMLIFGSDCERLCLLQFTLISLVPGLIGHLEDCAGPEMDWYVRSLKKPTSLRSSERESLLSYMGLPLTLFGKGSLFSPYTCLQQMDSLNESSTTSYIVGSTNGLFLRQKDRYSDVLIDLDEHKLSISSVPLQSALALTAADRRWIDGLTKAVNDTWDDAHPSRPTTHGYAGSEEFIRAQFEEYLLALISSVKYRMHLIIHPPPPGDETTPPDMSADYGDEFIRTWTQTPNFKILQKFTEPDLYNVVEPKHPCAGGLTIEDIQRRLAQQVADLHLDERFRSGREVIGTQLALGQQKVSSAFSKVWSDIEVLRENQRKRAEDKRKAEAESSATSPVTASSPSTTTPNQTESNKRYSIQMKAPDLGSAGASVSAAGAKAGAYLSSWGSWANDKRKSTWSRSSSSSETPRVSGAGAQQGQEMQTKNNDAGAAGKTIAEAEKET